MKSYRVIALLGLLLTSCASAPIQYYSLIPASPSPSVTRMTPYALDVLPVDVPAEADRSEWVTRHADGAVAILSNVQWAAPLDEELREAFAMQLAEETGAPLADGMGVDSHSILRVKLSLRRFDIAPGQPMLMVMDWSLGAPGGARMFCTNRFSAPPASSNIDALASIRQWQSALAHEIARDILTWGDKPKPACR